MDNPETIKAKSATSQNQLPTKGSSASMPSPVVNLLSPAHGATSSASSRSMPPASSDATRKVTRTLGDSIGKYIKAYFASLLTVGVIMPVVASLIAVGLYLTSSSPIPLFGLQSNSPWYVPVYGSLLAAILWLVVALPFCFMCTAQGANSRNYNLLRSRLHQLKASLGLKDYADGSYEEINTIETIMNHAGFNEHNKHQRDVLKEAYACCIDISRKLYKSPAGLPWIIGTGYNSAWALLHHAEEVMIEVQDVENLVRGAKHDFLAIEGSKMNGQDELLGDLVQAISMLKSEALVYFKEHQPSKSGVALSQLTQLIQQSNRSPLAAQTSDKSDAADPAAQASGKNGAADQTPQAPGKDSIESTIQARGEAVARVMLREVNQRWEGIVRQRSRLMMSIVVTGIITHALLCVITLTNPPPVLRLNLLAAALFYMIGAAAGVFVRFYSESQGGSSVDDFGLSTTRLMAIPLLSGLAGVGGVFVLGGLAILGGPALFNVNTAQSITFGLSRLFSPDPQFLLAAAIFGVTPNLLIKGLQQKAQEYESELKSSKAAETQAGGSKS